MLNLQMTFFGSIELRGYKQYMKGSSRKKILKDFIFETLGPILQRISGKREDTDTLGH